MDVELKKSVENEKNEKKFVLIKKKIMNNIIYNSFSKISNLWLFLLISFY